MAFWQGALADFSIKKYPSTIRWENGVLISHFCAYFLENFLALTIRWKKRVLIPPFALKNCRKFCSLLYAGKTGFLHPPPAHIFQKIFISHYTLIKSLFINPLAEKFRLKILPFTIRRQKCLLAPPLFAIFPKRKNGREQKAYQNALALARGRYSLDKPQLPSQLVKNRLTIFTAIIPFFGWLFSNIGVYSPRK